MKYKFVLSLIILGIVGFMACQPAKKSSSKGKGKGKKGAKSGKTVSSAPAVPRVLKLKSTDSLFVTLERTACLSACPTYKIEIYYKGYVAYHGYTFSDRTGDFYTVLPKEQLLKIFNYAKGMKYFSLNDSYTDPNISDVATAVTSLQVAKKTKTIVDGHYQTPSELIFFEKLIDESFAKSVWKPILK